MICSSFEVLSGLALTEEEFLKEKGQLVPEILDIIKNTAQNEAQLMLQSHRQTGNFLTDVSNQISEQINDFTYRLLDYLEKIPLANTPENPLVKCFLNYCPETLRTKYRDALLEKIPESHKKAIIACRIASRIVYRWGLTWSPSIVDILPIIWENEEITGI